MCLPDIETPTCVKPKARQTCTVCTHTHRAATWSSWLLTLLFLLLLSYSAFLKDLCGKVSREKLHTPVGSRELSVTTVSSRTVSVMLCSAGHHIRAAAPLGYVILTFAFFTVRQILANLSVLPLVLPCLPQPSQ